MIRLDDQSAWIDLGTMSRGKPLAAKAADIPFKHGDVFSYPAHVASMFSLKPPIDTNGTLGQPATSEMPCILKHPAKLYVL